MSSTSRITYRNPVWPHYFADPFVLRTKQGYFAYGTAPGDANEKQFPVLKSQDLVHWEAMGHALQPLRDRKAFAYWAPEVAEHAGRFYMFYSATTSPSDEHHRLRVAVAELPQGPFVDSRKELLPNVGFTIDASPFRDPVSGKWFLYFAQDYTEDSPHGTGLAVIRLSDDLLSAAGESKVVLRASCDWQVYERNRNYKGRVWEAWHCVEGPFVVHHANQYWCLYSGGAWHTENYGVGFAVADSPLGPWKDDRAVHGPTVLRGVAEKVIGPGHNSVVMGPDGKTMYIVYHAWEAGHSARRMCVDPLIWSEEGPKCDGPSFGERTV